MTDTGCTLVLGLPAAQSVRIDRVEVAPVVRSSLPGGPGDVAIDDPFMRLVASGDACASRAPMPSIVRAATSSPTKVCWRY